MPAVAREPKLFLFEVNLARDHLDASVPGKCRSCAVALAVEEAVGSHRFVGVSIDGRVIVKAHSRGRHVEAVLEDPEEVAEIVRMVDAGRADEVRPRVLRMRCPFEPLREL